MQCLDVMPQEFEKSTFDQAQKSIFQALGVY